MRTYNNSIVIKFDTTATGNAGAGKPVTVYEAGTVTKAELFNSAEQAITNPVNADNEGNYSFKVANGIYDIVIDQGLPTQVKIENELITDAAGGGSGSSAIETIQLTSGQVLVQFTVNTEGASFYINGTGADNGRILESVNYSYNQSLNQVTLTNSYPSGTYISAIRDTGYINEDYVRYFDELSDAVTSTKLAIGDQISLKERTTGNGGGGMWDVVLASTVTPNTFNIVACTGVPTLALKLQEDNELLSSQWGSVESSTIDSSLVIQAMGDYATPGAGQTIIIEGDVFLANKPIIPAGVSIICKGAMTSDSPTNDVSFGIGSPDVFTAYTNIVYDITLLSKTESDFSNIDNIGVLFENIIGADITLRAIRGFTTNAVGRGNTSTSSSDRGFAWNNVKVGDMENMLIGFDLRVLNGGGGVAFANQNNIRYFGRTMQRNAIATSLTAAPAFVDSGVINCYAVRGENVNGNTFYNQSLELNWTRSSDAQVFNGTGFLFNNSVNNISLYSRFENAFSVAKLTGDSKDNSFTTLYSDTSNQPNIIDESDTQMNELIIQDELGLQPKGASWDSGPLAQTTQQYSAGKITTMGASWTYTSGSVDPVIESPDSTSVALPDGISLSSSGNRGLTWRLETQRQKKFVIRRQYKAGDDSGRIIVSARKPDGTQWTDSDADSPYVKANVDLNFFGATFKGWKEPTNSSKDLFISVGDDVDHVLIQFSQGTIQRVQIQSLEQGCPVVTSGLAGYNSKQRVVKISPVDGFWTQGEEAVNFNASASQPIFWKAEQTGWACGTPWLATTSYAVNDIVYNGPNVYICRVAGASSGSGGPIGSGSGIVDGAVTWDYVASRVTFRAGPSMP